MSEEIMPQAAKIKTPEDELLVLAELAQTTYFIILKRTVRRVIELNKNSVFLLNQDDPKFVSKFSEFTNEARGMNKLIKLIEGAKIEIAKREGDKTGGE